MGKKADINIYSDSAKKKKKGKAAAIIIIIAVVLLLLAAAWIWFFNRDLISGILPQETTAATTEQVTTEVSATEQITEAPVTEAVITVPDVVGKKSKDAYDELNGAGLKYTVVREYSEEVKAEYVLSQEPEAGNTVKKSDRIVLHISKGVDHPPETTVQKETSATDPTKSSDKKTGGSGGDYILDGSDSRYISKSEVYKLSENEMTLALNEIYARHGRKFNTPEIQEYFNKQDWYNGTISPSDFDEASLTGVERSNVNTILSVMTEKGYR